MADLSLQLSKTFVQGTGMLNYTTPVSLLLDITNTSKKKIDITGVFISIKNTFWIFFSTDIRMSDKKFSLNPNANARAQFDIANFKEKYPNKKFTVIVCYNDGYIAQSDSTYFSEF